MSPSCSWIGELDRNARGRPVLSEERARELARHAAHGKLYTALYATQWTVGKVGNEDYSGFHILDGRGGIRAPAAASISSPLGHCTFVGMPSFTVAGQA